MHQECIAKMRVTYPSLRFDIPVVGVKIAIEVRLLNQNAKISVVGLRLNVVVYVVVVIRGQEVVQIRFPDVVIEA